MAQENQTTKEDKIRLTMRECFPYTDIISLDVDQIQTDVYSVWVEVGFVSADELARLPFNDYSIHPRENAVMVHGYFKQEVTQ